LTSYTVEAKTPALKQLGIAYLAITSDNIPKLSTMPDIMRKGYHDWLNSSGQLTSPGPLQSVLSRLAPTIKHITNTAIQRHFEKEYRAKMWPRNVSLGSVVLAKTYRYPQMLYTKDPIEERKELYLEVARKIGLGRTWQDSCNLYDCKPPNYAAGAGFNGFGSVQLGGKKHINWQWLIADALDLVDKIERDKRFCLGLLDDYDAMSKLAREYLMLTGFGLRLDGGPLKPRRLIPGASTVYMLDWLFFGHKHDNKPSSGLTHDLEMSPYIGTTSQKARDYLRHNQGACFTSGDTSDNDTETMAQDMAASYYALGRLYSIPDEIVAFLATYNIALQYVSDYDPKMNLVTVQEHIGSNKSGIGPSFVAVNELKTETAEYYITEYLNDPQLALVFGDDRVTTSNASGVTRNPLFKSFFNITAKPSAQYVGTDGFNLCRRIYLANTEVTLPVLHSVVRNIVCPEDVSIEQLKDTEIAVSRRAASYNLVNASRNLPAWRPLRDLWYRYLAPEETLMLKYTDEELSAMLPIYSQHRDDLTYAKIRF
jgi:hypothetical protein